MNGFPGGRANLLLFLIAWRNFASIITIRFLVPSGNDVMVSQRSQRRTIPRNTGGWESGRRWHPGLSTLCL